ncbi:sensor histidine kinase [Paenibacillus rhizovicinus]|uniref:histidine kinase n=1 Tax=Paenibacillus rhizovicinus TaxID=2704463 RepID=A0A6C0NTT3_9BACL|nr:sensor histidine kinase [Paenibacillus rhizovicinus]QHW29624.1 sensor histidine kinase [Paenibacillus rhizovicinus]
MELWTLGNKTIVWLYVIALTYFAHPAAKRLLVLYFLLYFAFNLLILIAKPARAKQGLIALVIGYLILCGSFVKPEFLLLLPFACFEFASYHIRDRRAVFVLVLAPMLFLPTSLLVHYGFIAIFVYFNFVIVMRFMERVHLQEDELERARRRLQLLGRQLNDNAEYARASEYLVKLEERNRVAQEIHDGIGHAITGGLIQMEAARLTLHRDADAAEALLRNAIAISKDGIEQIRRTLKDMKPPVEQLGLGRLRTAVETFGSQSDLLTTIVHEGDIEAITPIQWKIIHENVMEALTNAAKYACASAVHVEIRVLNRFIKAVVEDNGQGAGMIVKGMGLIGMEERTAALNGTVTADGERGFVVTTLLPRSGE